MALTSGSRLGPYQITERIGAGGMGEVYKASDTRLNRTVAIKVLSPGLTLDSHARQRFAREARVIAGLNHPHICALFDIGEHGGSDFLVMEYLDGVTLASRLVRGSLSLEQTVRYAMEMARALSAAHEAGIVHRDLKPANVILTRAGVKLLDFGLAKLRYAPGAPKLPTLFGPPANPQVGDTWDSFLWNLSGMPVANLDPCTVRSSGPHVYIVVEDAQWNLGRVTQTQVDNVLRYFESESLGLFPTEGIWSLDTTAFGFPAIGLDNDPKVYILYYDFGTPNADGYVGWADAYPDNPGDPFGRSNECEVLYMNTRPGMGVDHTPDHAYMLSVVAHEVEHLIHRAYDRARRAGWTSRSPRSACTSSTKPGTEFTSTFQGNPDISLTKNPIKLSVSYTQFITEK